MSFLTLLFFLFVQICPISALGLSAKSLNGTSSLTAYEVLEEYGFPVGILPKGVLSYEIDNATGQFSAHFNASCAFTIESYELKYDSTITGKISEDKISDLSGVKVKVLFVWLSVVTVTRGGDELEFSVGIASADFPVTNFDGSPTCGCGFDCVGGVGGGHGVSTRARNNPKLIGLLESLGVSFD